jgi:hypothetical protein
VITRHRSTALDKAQYLARFYAQVAKDIKRGVVLVSTATFAGQDLARALGAYEVASDEAASLRLLVEQLKEHEAQGG